MGSGDWFKTIISKGKKKHEPSSQGAVRGQSNGFKLKYQSKKASNKSFKGSYSRNKIRNSVLISEEAAATQIQTAFRGYQARKILRKLKSAQRLCSRSDGDSVKRQTSSTLYHVQRWSRSQTEIRARRASMVTEGRIKQKKHENQVKLEAKLHDLEVEWCGGAETMEETLSKVYQREAAAVKRERAMAYAFSHQWRASPSNQCQAYQVDKAGNWGWSWTERWIAVRPWEARISTAPKVQPKSSAKTIKKSSPPKPPISASKNSAKKSSPPEDEKAVNNHEQYSALMAAQTTRACEVA